MLSFELVEFFLLVLVQEMAQFAISPFVKSPLFLRTLLAGQTLVAQQRLSLLKHVLDERPRLFLLLCAQIEFFREHPQMLLRDRDVCMRSSLRVIDAASVCRGLLCGRTQDYEEYHEYSK